MSYTGRLTILNSAISAMPMYAMGSFKVTVTTFVHFEKKKWKTVFYVQIEKKKLTWQMSCQLGIGM
jgi:hypothetical protein